jgi:hypothetical protein
VALVFLGCASKQIMPLEVGNKWHYRWAYFSSFGDTLKKQNNHILIDRDTSIASESWSLIRKNYGDTISTYSFATNRSDGLHRFFRLSSTQYLDLPYPAEVGTIAVKRDTLDSETIMVDSVYLQSTDELVAVPAGVFRSYHYLRTSIYTKTINSETRSHVSTSEEFYAPGIGFVKGLYYATSKTEHKPNEEVLLDYIVR